MDIDLIADYEVRFKVPDQDGLTDNEFIELADGMSTWIQSAIIQLAGPPPDGSVDVVLRSAVLNGKPLIGGSNAQ